ncbi:MAG: hypothetical protein M1839_002133 [Geoglossum umbratile]|nr:MAG: hypothetical protein M1839_002133 [Geoglossum umbratile]
MSPGHPHETGWWPSGHPRPLLELPELPSLQNTPMRWAGSLLAIPDTLLEFPKLPHLQNILMRQAQGLLAIPNTLLELPKAPGPSVHSSSGSEESFLPLTLFRQDCMPGVPTPVYKAVEHGLGIPAGLTVPALPHLLGKERGNLCQQAQSELKCTRALNAGSPAESYLQFINGLPLAPSAALANPYNSGAEEINSEFLGDNNDDDSDNNEEK